MNVSTVARTLPTESTSRRGLWRRLRWVVLGLLVLAAVAVAAGWLWIDGRLDGSLPRIAGELAVSGLEAPVTVARDGLGIPVIDGAHRRDVAFATGFVHAQDRYFQMDMLRRRPAGELAALLGEPGLEDDRRLRPYRLRERARRALDELSPEERRIVDAYRDGVNAGLGDLGAAPWEYMVLGVSPEPWRAEDTLLAVACMYTYLQDWPLLYERTLSLMRDRLPAEMYAFLVPQTTRYDVPVAGELGDPLPVPGPEVLDLRDAPPAAEEEERRVARLEAGSRARRPELGGSNAWALSGDHTEHGGAILANDLHLGLGVPNIWYRVSLSWRGAGGERRSVTGMTLPGAPTVVVGSNGRVAWGFTNSLADSNDLVWVETLGEAGERYRGPDGPLPFERHVETIEVEGGEPVELEVVSTLWGPLVGEDHQGRPLAQRWAIHEPGSIDLSILGLETAETVDEAVEVANRAGLPAQNLLLADADGRIAWTVAGYLPRRVGFRGDLPGSWAGGARSWDGRVPPEEYPRVVDPEGGRLWSGNNRMIGGERLSTIGAEGFQLAARARQIHDRLVELESAGPDDMLDLQLDHRARLWEPWRELILETLDDEAVEGHPARSEFRRFVEEWDGYASPDSVGFRLVRSYRINVGGAVLDPLTTFEGAEEAGADYEAAILELEEPLLTLVETRPAHLLDPAYSSWEELFLDAVDVSMERIGAAGGGLEDKTWGAINATDIRHPFSGAIPWIDRWVDMPRQELPGAYHVPRVQGPNSGATVRFAVAPGHEASGYLHMPVGQSAHPRSAHFSDSHAAWAAGEPTPFLAGEERNVLRLTPGGEGER